MKTCPNCGKANAPAAKFCGECGTSLENVQNVAAPETAAPSQDRPPDPKNQEKTVDLAAEISNLTWWGSRNAFSGLLGDLFPLGGVFGGLVIFLLNPFWLVVSVIFSMRGDARLKAGDFAGAKKAVRTASAVNWCLVLVGVLVWSTGTPLDWCRRLSGDEPRSAADKTNQAATAPTRLSGRIYHYVVEIGDDAIRDCHPDASNDEIATLVASAKDETVSILRDRLATIGIRHSLVVAEGGGRFDVQISDISTKQRENARRVLRFGDAMDFRLVSTRSDDLRQRLLASGLVPPGYKMADANGSYYVRDKSVPEPDPRSLRQFGNPPPGYVFALEKASVGGQDAYYPIFVERRARMTGSALSRVSHSTDKKTGEMRLKLRFDAAGTREFAEVTRKYCSTSTSSGRRLVVVLGGIVCAAQNLEKPISDGTFSMQTSLTEDDAKTLSVVLRAGTRHLPAPARIVEQGWL